MPKLFRPSIVALELLIPVTIQDDAIFQNARQNFSFSLKKYYYFVYIASFKVTASSSGYYKSEPFDICDYCKGNVTVTASSQFKVKTPIYSGKEYAAKTAPSPYKTAPPTTFELMCQWTTNEWIADVQQKYRRTNAADGALNVSNVSDRKEKKRNCCKDYDDDGNKISENPDTSFWDYTVTFDSRLTLGCTWGGAFFDDVNLRVYPYVDFGGIYQHMNWSTQQWLDTYKDCKIQANGTLVFAGLNVTAKPWGLGNSCGNQGQLNIQETWTPSSKLKLI